MKVILLQDIPKLGKKSQVKNVADGFARNYLFPRGLAEPASQTNVQELERIKESEIKKAQKDLSHAQELASGLDGVEVFIKAKTNNKGGLYSAISDQKISQALKDQGYNIGKNQVQIQEEIKNPGEYSATVVLQEGIEAEIRVSVVSEEGEDRDENKEPAA